MRTVFFYILDIYWFALPLCTFSECQWSRADIVHEDLLNEEVNSFHAKNGGEAMKLGEESVPNICTSLLHLFSSHFKCLYILLLKIYVFGNIIKTSSKGGSTSVM